MIKQKKTWNIAKQFDFCYGHRVWSQKLNKEFSLDNRCVCRHLHGHQGKIIIHLEGEHLTDGMVTDFKHLNWFKKFLDDTLDHKFIIDENDPMVDNIIPGGTGNWDWITHNDNYLTINPESYKDEDPDLQDILEGFVMVEFVPTSENLSSWMLDIAQAKMNGLDIFVKSIEFFETPKSQSVCSQERPPREVFD